MEIKSIKEELNSLAYHGRGIMIGKSADGKKAVMAYFIMGRSENSRNRVFVVILPYIRESVNALAWCPNEKVEIVASSLGDNAALVAAEYYF